MTDTLHHTASRIVSGTQALLARPDVTLAAVLGLLTLGTAVPDLMASLGLTGALVAGLEWLTSE